MASIIRRTYQVKNEAGKIETRKCDHWTIQYRNAAGKIQRVKGYKDKGATKQLAAKIELQLARGEQVMIDPFKATKAAAIVDHIDAYTADLAATGRDETYIYTMGLRLKSLADGCGWDSLADINPASFIKWRNERQKTGNPKGCGNRLEKGASATTLNQFLDSARAFTNWCATTGRLPGVAVGSRVISPLLSGVSKAEGPKVWVRRALADDEVTRLLDVTPDSRKLFYRVGMSLGLRRAELGDLVWGDVRLNAIKPYVQLRAEATKANRADRLDIPATLAEDLRKAKPGDATERQRVFPKPPSIEEWWIDLAAAKIDQRDDMGRVADFHAGTRKTLCSRMHRQGVPLAVAMRRMRHTDAKLTLIDYTDDQQIGMEAANLPELMPVAPATDTKPAVSAG